MKDFTKGLIAGVIAIPLVDFYTNILDNCLTVISNKMNRLSIDDVVYCNKKSVEMEAEETSTDTFAIGFQPPELDPEYETEEE